MLQRAPDYGCEIPIVYYGSSITQGGCASRPGMCCQNILLREFDNDCVDLGFSGSALAEENIVDYMAGLSMRVFVLDYDHNAPDVAHLEATHEKTYLRIREKNPELPILMMSRPKFYLNPENVQRRAIVRATYEKELAEGDRWVWFLDGSALMADAGDNGTVDNIHPTDWGFCNMARAMAPVLREMLGGKV